MLAMTDGGGRLCFVIDIRYLLCFTKVRLDILK
jgi:hypothetical protein